MAKTDEKQPDEGIRNFTTFLAQVDDGELAIDCGDEQQKMVRALEREIEAGRTKVAGTLTIKLRYELTKRGTIEVTSDVSAKPPKKGRSGNVFWATKGGNLTAENPRQQKLPLREVPTPRREARELEDDARPTRSI